MDFPFEYIERVFSRPKFDRNEVTKEAQKCTQLPKEQVLSEEDEVDGFVPEIEKEKEKILLNEIRNAEIIVKKEGNKEHFSSECSSSDSNYYDSVGDTSDTDVVNGFYQNPKERDEIVYKKHKIMRECYCTGSECESNCEITISSSSSTTLTSSESENCSDDNADETVGDGSSSDETTSSSDDEMDMDEEIEYLENLLKEMNKQEDKKNEKSEDGDSEDSTDDLESMFDEPASSKLSEKSDKSSEKSEKLPEKSNAEPTAVETDSSAESSTTTEPTDQSVSDSFILSSSDADDENSENNLEKFNWQSDDLYESTDTDSGMEQVLGYLGRAMAESDGQFSNALVIETEKLQKEKYQNFQVQLPEYLKTKKSYELMEEPVTQKQSTDIISKQLWLVQQLDTGIMCSAKLVSRKNPDHLQLQKNLDKERKLLYELLPELSKPSHIARLLDVGVDENFKFLIFEDLGMDLITLFEEFGSILTPSTLFLITYFTFNSIKELHSFDILHLDIRPSVFSVSHYPFNIKIVDYSKCIRKRSNMRVSEEMKVDAFSPRVFHKQGAEFDKFVDFESWVYTMIHCTTGRLIWAESDLKSMLERKEEIMDDPQDTIYDGCIEAVPIAANLINDKKNTYEDFLDKMNLVFSVDVMRFSDEKQPRLWSIKELDEIQKRKNLGISDEEMNIELIESHWNPFDDSDSDDAIESENEKKEKDEKGKTEKKKPSKEDQKDKGQTQSMSEQSSNTEQWTEANSGQEKSEAERSDTKRNPKKEMAEQSTAHDQLSVPMEKNEEPPTKLEMKQNEQKTTSKASKAPTAPKGKKGQKPLLSRHFLFEMRRDLNAQSSYSSESSDSSSSFSSWTSSTSSTDGEKKFKWSSKSEEESVVEYLEDLSKQEQDRAFHYEHIRANCFKDNFAPSSGSERDPFSDIDSEDNRVVLRKLERRSEDVCDEMHSEKEDSMEIIEPEDFPNPKKTKKASENSKD
uniref:Protein kinase domain-containing protein n=1 Tax=Caenorhabditis tropicalis TaxID=1561998 RepID=A0A1I7V4Z3_9PELO